MEVNASLWKVDNEGGPVDLTLTSVPTPGAATVLALAGLTLGRRRR
jgi:MYXO-CTERM domain-containing protein